MCVRGLGRGKHARAARRSCEVFVTFQKASPTRLHCGRRPCNIPCVPSFLSGLCPVLVELTCDMLARYLGCEGDLTGAPRQTVELRAPLRPSLGGREELEWERVPGSRAERSISVSRLLDGCWVLDMQPSLEIASTDRLTHAEPTARVHAGSSSPSLARSTWFSADIWTTITIHIIQLLRHLICCC